MLERTGREATNACELKFLRLVEALLSMEKLHCNCNSCLCCGCICDPAISVGVLCLFHNNSVDYS